MTIHPDGLKACDTDGLSAVQGTLSTPAIAEVVKLTLEGPGPVSEAEEPWADASCTIEGDRYRCPALGYNFTTKHTLKIWRTSAGSRSARATDHEIVVEVNDCIPETVTFDIDL